MEEEYSYGNFERVIKVGLCATMRAKVTHSSIQQLNDAINNEHIDLATIQNLFDRICWPA